MVWREGCGRKFFTVNPATDHGELLHGGLLHLLFNCYASPPGASDRGVVRRAQVFRHLHDLRRVRVFPERASSVGRSPWVASGALFGLMGFGIVYGRFAAASSGGWWPTSLLRWVIYSVFMFFMPGIDNIGARRRPDRGRRTRAPRHSGPEPKTRAGEIRPAGLSGARFFGHGRVVRRVAVTYAGHLEELRQSGLLPG